MLDSFLNYKTTPAIVHFNSLFESAMVGII